MSSRVLIIGQGIAGTTMAFRCLQAGLQPRIIDSGIEGSASHVAVGLVNPISLKRVTPVWEVENCLSSLYHFYTYIYGVLGVDFFVKAAISKVLKNQADLNGWMEKMDMPVYEHYLRMPEKNEADRCIEGMAIGPVEGGGWIRTKEFLEASRNYFIAADLIIEGKMNSEILEFTPKGVHYQGEVFDYVVDCSGFAFVLSKYFPEVQVVGNKGEVMTISAYDPPNESIYSSNYFLLRSSPSEYKVGATYSRDISNPFPSAEGKAELTEGLQKFYKADFEVKGMEAGIRPTVVDRRPLIGQSSIDKRIAMLNGLGSRGYLTAPYLSELLLRSIAYSGQIPREVSCLRFLKAARNSE
jgi:glycine/D-amino acid oxidase-like deaminating enzyme